MGFGPPAVLYTPQTLSLSQAQQAVTNIGAAAAIFGSATLATLHSFTTGPNTDNVAIFKNRYSAGHSALFMQNDNDQVNAVFGIGNTGVGNLYLSRFFMAANPALGFQANASPDVIMTQEGTYSGAYSTYPRLLFAGSAQTLTKEDTTTFGVAAGDIAFFGNLAATVTAGRWTTPIMYLDGTYGPRSLNSSSGVATNGTGTVATSSWTVTGTGTKFITEAPVGSVLIINAASYLVVSVASDTSLKVDASAGTQSGKTFTSQLPSFSAFNQLDIHRQRMGVSPSGEIVIANDNTIAGLTLSFAGANAWRFNTANDGNLNFSNIFSQSNPLVIVGSSGETQLGGNLRLGVAATTGLVAGVLAATTNASIAMKDINGQLYRIPCII